MRADESDAQLHERLLAGDGDALAEVYDRYSALVYGVAVRVTGDRAAAEDLTQDVFVRFWERPGTYRPDRGSLRSWICMVARNRALDWIRREGVRARYQLAAVAEQCEQAWVDEGRAWWHEEVAAVRAAVGALPEPQREAVKLAYYGGRSYREVAGDLRIPEGTAKSRLRAALATIADRLSADGIIER